MKVLGVIKSPMSGVKYHRIFNPLSYLKANFTTKLTEDIVRHYDVIWMNRYTDTKPAYLAIWKSKYGFKLIFDLDDSWEVLSTNPGYKFNESTKKYSKDFCALADCITVSMEELIKEVQPFNSNIVVLNNRIPYGEGQFQIKDEVKEEFLKRKIRVGISGSESHIYDWKDIRPWLNQLNNNPLFRENCELVVCGVNPENPIIQKDFGFARLIPYQPVENYITIYNELDIMLCPLRDEWFNHTKSFLKPLEAACSKTVCILDHLYEEKSDRLESSHLFVKKEKEWMTHVFKLISDKEALWELKEKTSIEIRNRCEWTKDALEPRIDLMNKVLDIQEYPKFNIFSVKYREDQPTMYWPYLNTVNSIEQKSWRFEYNAILDIFDNKLEGVGDEEHVGVLSWKFPMKTGMFEKKMNLLIKNKDVYIFCKEIPNYMRFSENYHPGLKYLVKELCSRLNIRYSDNSKYTIYSNFVVAKKGIYKKYVEEVIKPSLELLEGEFWDLASKDAGYKAGLPKDQLKQFTGLDYYPLIVFILERMWSQYLNDKKYTVKNLI